MKSVLPFLALIAIGAAWGATQPLAKIAVSDGYRHFGLIFWQLVIGGALLVPLCLLRGKPVVWGRAQIGLYVFVAVIGTVLPGIASYSAAIHLPSGVLSILLSSVPMLSLPIALAMGLEGFSRRRFWGLALGLVGVALLVLPQASLPDGVPVFWIGVALLSSIFYALEGNVIAKWGTIGLDAMQVLAGASLVGIVISAPLAIYTGQFINPLGPWQGPDYALVAAAILHAGAYSGYVWLVGLAGSVFAAQVSYLVTLFGVTWAMIFLGEGYSGWIWAALTVMMAGVSLVMPRRRGLVQDRAVRQTTTV
ncbi:DMT family transporter [Pelagimonas varians]|uniref:Putative DMT superfamily transporter inner membrane protein n=1 Tax=Pelagimonas varians TaxID=696760 RepID=A0A238KXC7_9RHOB|nr:DMT family transporter [Pelagimonas varians]PYG27774.1 EamA-like transporter family protein [Pelagimonas varians]SMX47473.1 putative DMT superfamily transporter inner membrane protein [Pelagimonas varians]